MSTKHTPRPWRSRPHATDHYSMVIETSKAGTLAVVELPSTDEVGGVSTSNVDLIQAAPDMLDVLKMVRARLQKFNVLKVTLGRVDAVIQKAEGGNPLK